MSFVPPETGSTFSTPALVPGRMVDAGPLGELPRLSWRQVRLQERLGRASAEGWLGPGLSWLHEALGEDVSLPAPEVLWRPSGVKRPGVVAQLSWPRLATRLGVGIETPLAHALVDRLLGYDRLPAEGRLQVTPVEWGILTFVVAETLSRLNDHPGALGPFDLLIDRVGPDGFNPESLGSIVTLRWPVQIGQVTGSVRLWLSEALVALWLASVPGPVAGLSLAQDPLRTRFAELAGIWHAEVGMATLARGLGRLRKGGVLPIDGNPLRGTPGSPEGPVEITLSDHHARHVLPAEPAPGSGGRVLQVVAPLRQELLTREGLAVSAPAPSSTTPEPGANPADVPVTLVVELGRVNLPLRRLADLKPGDVLELGRHAKEPVELTSNGRLIARGELVQIDAELGVRVLSVFL